MADPKQTGGDRAAHGGGIGDVERQPVDPTSENRGEATPDVPAAGTAGVGLKVDPDPRPSGEDLDRDADETLGTVV